MQYMTTLESLNYNTLYHTLYETELCQPQNERVKVHHSHANMRQLQVLRYQALQATNIIRTGPFVVQEIQTKKGTSNE